MMTFLPVSQTLKHNRQVFIISKLSTTKYSTQSVV